MSLQRYTMMKVLQWRSRTLMMVLALVATFVCVMVSFLHTRPPLVTGDTDTGGSFPHAPHAPHPPHPYRESTGVGWPRAGVDLMNEPRVASYCNVPEGVKIGDEGQVSNNLSPTFTLTSAYVILRHGDITPASTPGPWRRSPPSSACSFDTSLLPLAARELRHFLSDLQAQRGQQPAGDPFTAWALYPQQSRCGGSQLTGRGAVQQLVKGLALREAYIHRWRLLGPGFPDTGQLDLRSERVSRSYQSAVAFLYGFLPGRFNLSRLSFRGSETGSFFCRPAVVPEACCALRFHNLKWRTSRAVRARTQAPPRTTLLSEPSGILTSLAGVLGVKVSQLPRLTDLVNVFQGYVCHGLPIPCPGGGNKTGGACVTAAMMEALWDLVDERGRADSRDARFDRHCRVLSHPLLTDIVSSMLRVCRKQSAVRFSLFSGDERTVTAVLQALGVYEGRPPALAATLALELWTTPRRSRAKGEHFVRVVYDGEDVTSLVRFCRGRGVDGLCRLKYFQSFVERDNLLVMGVAGRQSLKTFCQSHLRSGKTHS